MDTFVHLANVWVNRAEALKIKAFGRKDQGGVFLSEERGGSCPDVSPKFMGFIYGVRMASWAQRVPQVPSPTSKGCPYLVSTFPAERQKFLE